MKMGNTQAQGQKWREPTLTRLLMAGLQAGVISGDWLQRRLNRELSFRGACGYELALLLGALLWGWVTGRPALASCHWDLFDVLVGIVAAAPVFVFFFWSLRSRLAVFHRQKQLLERLLRPLFERWSVAQLAMISLIAGVAEEALFRGVIQGDLAERVGVVVAVIAASAAFGAAHLLTWAYAVITALIGAYLGLLWVWSGNLLTPMITHAVYDFVALVYFLRMHPAAKT